MFYYSKDCKKALEEVNNPYSNMKLKSLNKSELGIIAKLLDIDCSELAQ